jgi:hypothetical protein
MLSRRRLPLPLAALLIASTLDAQQTVTLPRADVALTGSPAQLFAVGRADGESWETFSGVAALAFDGQDNLYVLDSQNRRILVFDRDGRFVRQFGRRGDGPGDFQLPLAMALTAEGIVVADMGRRAYLRFSLEGAAQGSVPWAIEQATPAIVLGLRPHPTGSLVVAMPTPIDMSALMAQARAGGPMRMEAQHATLIQLVPLTANGTSARLFEHTPWAPPDAESYVVTLGPSPVQMSMPPTVLFAPGLHWDVLPDGTVVVVNTAEYSVTLLTSAGVPSKRITRPITPRRVTKEDEEKARETLSKDFEEARALGPALPPGAASDMIAEMLRKQLENVRYAPVVPVLSDLRTDPSGRLWLLRAPATANGQATIDIVGADGKYLGSLAGEKLPSAFSRSGRVAYIERDALGVERLEVKQLPASWR